MISNTITLSSNGNGMDEALREAESVANQGGLNDIQGLQLRLIAEEMMAMLRSVSDELKAVFFIEWEGMDYKLHLQAKQKLSSIQRSTLIKASTSGQNAAAVGFLGKLRDVFEQALSVSGDVSHYYAESGYPTDVDISDEIIAATPRDDFERSVLRTVADQVVVGIKGGNVDMVITKKF